MCAEAQLTTTVWNPAANPSGNGLWSESANWTGGQVANSTNKVVLNVAGARACVVNSASTPVNWSQVTTAPAAFSSSPTVAVWRPAPPIGPPSATTTRF